MNRRPFDPRLLRRVPAARGDLVLLAVLGVVAALLIIAQATALAALLATGFDGRLDRPALAGFLAAVTARSALTWAQGTVAARLAATVKATLRADLLGAVGRHGPTWVAGQRAGQLATLTGRGLDALDAYFTGYLPQLVLSVTVPAAVLLRVLVADWSSALIIAATLPLIPIFGALLGWQAQVATERQWRRLSRLGGHFLDMVAGLPTLRAFGRARAQVDVVHRMADGHRVATMKTLRIAFLSGLVLELVATLSVALVAVPVGIRLLDGGLALSTALLVLLLTPEAYLPLRTAGARFHASMEGLSALNDAFAVSTDDPDTARPAPAPAPDGRGEIRLEGVTVAYPRTTALRDVTLTIRPGERIAVIGPSGAGKSTLLGLLLGFVAPTEGRVTVDGVDLAGVDQDAWRRQVAWVPQRAHLFAASLADNIRLGVPETPDAALAPAIRDAALDDVVAALPDGLTTRLGERGHGLSSGQRQRVALARAFLRDAPVVLLDEPTARLDTASETAVLAATRRLVAGRTALLVAHRPALLADADRILRVVDGRVTELTPNAEVLA
ncbi:glutathione/cysteine ABC transporter ATP-binding protein [Micromonospora rosaria]|uniref:Glutathione/cysteine ABC transporter ATP-binding protein n=1 Tax=Micromonospora rosaria TaxID=47874 RepID=A0A136PMC5_9ACTN|nr:thiol reductant ABC exporter subunit CydD [Micromonospora rosaria]KXK59605.1 glutathione/cysteine ABC transporter ATP-binding protein [Micromonospora rosaria]